MYITKISIRYFINYVYRYCNTFNAFCMVVWRDQSGRANK